MSKGISSDLHNPDISSADIDDYSEYYNGLFYEFYREGRESFYAIQDQAQDFLFYLKLAEEIVTSSSILELGCGNGRIAIRLSELGFRVTGIDIARPMLEEARRHSNQVEWVEGDVRDFDLGKKFQLIMFPFDGLQHLLNIEDIEAGLACIRKHLEEDGKFIIDITNPTSKYLANILFENGRRVDSVFPNPNGQGTVIVTQTRQYDDANQILKLKKFFYFSESKKEVVKEVAFRAYFPKELELLLRANGFEIEKRFGNYQGCDFQSDSPKLIVVVRKK